MKNIYVGITKNLILILVTYTTGKLNFHCVGKQKLVQNCLYVYYK